LDDTVNDESLEWLKFGKFTMKLLNISWSHSKLVDESLANFINLPNPPNFIHSKLSSFTVSSKDFLLYNSYGDVWYFIVHSTGLHSNTAECISEPIPMNMKSSLIDIKKLKTRYIKHLSTDDTDWPLQYIRLALLKGEKVTRADKNLEEITKLTLQGQIDELLLRKEPLDDLRDIFHYKNKPCPRLIVIMGGPGEY